MEGLELSFLSRNVTHGGFIERSFLPRNGTHGGFIERSFSVYFL